MRRRRLLFILPGILLLALVAGFVARRPKFDRFASLRQYIKHDNTKYTVWRDPSTGTNRYTHIRRINLRVPDAPTRSPKVFIEDVLDPADWKWNRNMLMVIGIMLEEGFEVSRGEESYRVDIHYLEGSIDISQRDDLNAWQVLWEKANGRRFTRV